MKPHAALLAALILLAPVPAAAFSTGEFLESDDVFKNGFLTGAVDVAIVTATPERGRCILNWYSNPDHKAPLTDIAQAMYAADPTKNAVGVLLDVMLKKCPV